MGGGSALLINSNRRGGSGGSEFGCTGWFCDILDGAMMILVIMIIATAFLGCLKSCFNRKRKYPDQEIEPKRISEQPQNLGHQESSEAPPTHLPVVIVMENPPDYEENEESLYLPPSYCTLRFDQNAQGVQI
ncbi:hypothetical protein CRE_14224 [Caenorhabditis remanei]|uniref:Uncharacterized protein n=1 Tax=Caenorhabditis remanei TaxID=31234 RepID=E3N1K4_CAERE|nr:hypothetical protein CRE_14224 [Caenorhabditis remanei]